MCNISRNVIMVSTEYLASIRGSAQIINLFETNLIRLYNSINNT